MSITDSTSLIRYRLACLTFNVQHRFHLAFVLEGMSWGKLNPNWTLKVNNQFQPAGIDIYLWNCLTFNVQHCFHNATLFGRDAVMQILIEIGH